MKFILFSTLFKAILLFRLSFSVKDGENCTESSECEWGSQRAMCFASGNFQLRCNRLIPVHPYLRVKHLPYNKYSWLTTPSSYANFGEGSSFFAPITQDDTVTQQLRNGIRGLILDMYDYKDDIWLCFGQCTAITACKPAVNVLNEVRAFLESNSLEIVTIFIEDHVVLPNGLSNLFDASGLRRFWFPVSVMPKNGGNWPIIDYMIGKNRRLVVFTSRPEKEASEGIAYKWNYMVENDYDNDVVPTIWCPNRPESEPMNSKTKNLVLMNSFRREPYISEACKYNSDFLLKKLTVCSLATGFRWPNFTALDFYKRSVNGEVAKAVDTANGQSICGCSIVAFCKPKMKVGACRNP